MRRHIPIARMLLVLIAGAVLSSCAHSPRVIDENEAVLSIRTDYLRSNPAGPYNDFIRRGEVVKGMNYVEVLAAWGFPESRLRVPERSAEYWRYVSRDELSRDWIQYTFVFEGDALAEWEMMRQASKGRAVSLVEFPEPRTNRPPDGMRPLQSSTVVKR